MTPLIFSYYFLSTLLFATTTTLVGISQAAAAAAAAAPAFSKVYAFGDSYTDTGNTVSATGPSGFSYVSSPPYGMTYFHRPTNRYSDGRLVVDFLAGALSLPLLPPYRSRGASARHGANFAVAGSTAIEHAFFVRNNLTLDVTPESLGTQLAWFGNALGEQGCGRGGDPLRCGPLLDDALIWVGEIGANDYAYSALSTVDSTLVQELAITRISAFLEAILSKGAKYVVVQGLPPTGCLTLSMVLSSPSDRDGLGCVKSLNDLSVRHNALLQSEIGTLRSKFPGALILYADYYNAYASIMRDKAKYGLKEAFKACCGSGTGPYSYDFFAVCGSPSSSPCPDPSEYVNWDGVHLTDAMNKAVSGLLFQGGYSHPDFKLLLHRKDRQG